MRIDIVSIFPELITPYLEHSIIKLARERGVVEVRAHNLRDFTHDKHRQVDDYPFGGGAGMVMKPEPWYAAVEALSEGRQPRPWTILTSQAGVRFDHSKAAELAARPALMILCGRYEGVDERVAEGVVNEEISAGDYVLTGGELPALIILDAVARLLPGVLGNEASATDESFGSGLLEYPQYTRPQEYRGRLVPEVLLSGHHEQIRRWRRREALRRTLHRRPDVLQHAQLTDEDQELLEELVADEREACCEVMP